MKKVINLYDHYCNPFFLCFSGVEEGQKVREKEELMYFNLLDDKNSLEIIIPPYIIAIEASWLWGLFNDSLRVFNTKEEIMNKVKFVVDSDNEEYIGLINEDIDWFIARVLDKRTIDEILGLWRK